MLVRFCGRARSPPEVGGHFLRYGPLILCQAGSRTLLYKDALQFLLGINIGLAHFSSTWDGGRRRLLWPFTYKLVAE